MAFKYKMLAIITPTIFILDQLTKWIIQSTMRVGEFIPVIPGYFDIVHVLNKGAAFGMLASTSDSFRIPFFYGITLLAIVVIVILVVKLPTDERLMAVIFSLILGGIAGNVLDRIRFGEVTDFLSFHILDKAVEWKVFGYDIYYRLEWPAFNVADMAISAAMILLIYSLFKPSAKKE